MDTFVVMKPTYKNILRLSCRRALVIFVIFYYVKSLFRVPGEQLDYLLHHISSPSLIHIMKKGTCQLIAHTPEVTAPGVKRSSWIETVCSHKLHTNTRVVSRKPRRSARLAGRVDYHMMAHCGTIFYSYSMINSSQPSILASEFTR